MAIYNTYTDSYLAAVNNLPSPAALRPTMALAELELQIERLAAKAAALRAWGEDDYEDGEVISFEILYGDSAVVYSYVAIKAKGRWYLSGREGHEPTRRSWEQLVETFVKRGITPDKVFRVTAWEALG